MSEPLDQKWAAVYFNGDFFVVLTHSGYRGGAYDPDGYEGHFSPDSFDEELGSAVIKAIEHSRFLRLEEIDDFFAPAKIASRYSAWVNSLIERYKYGSRRALFKNMALCNITVTDNEMEIMPMRHDKLEAWAGLESNKQASVLIAADDQAADIGRALRVAFDRCE